MAASLVVQAHPAHVPGVRRPAPPARSGIAAAAISMPTRSNMSAKPFLAGGRALVASAPRRVSVPRTVRRIAVRADAAVSGAFKLDQPGKNLPQVTVAMKFGGSSVRDAERMREVANIICSFPDQCPAVVLSAMGKSTNLLLECAELALKTSPNLIPEMMCLREVKTLHRDTVVELDIDTATREEVEELLKNLEKLLVGISMMNELTLRGRDTLVSFGERLSTRIFAGYLRRCGVNARQLDAFDIGFISTDDFTNGQLLPATYAKLRESLTREEGEEPYLPIITGFLARGVESNAITTLGRGGSDLSATVIGKALNLSEVQVWKDVDGVLTADPRLIENPCVVNELTYDEATELSYFGAQVLHPQAMRPAIEQGGSLNVRVKNSYNISAPGTVIQLERDMTESLLTSIVKKSNVVMLDIVSSRMLGQYGFLAKVFNICAEAGVSVDVVATSEVSVSLTLDTGKIWSRDLEESELEALRSSFEELADVSLQRNKDIISLICNVGRSSEILEIVFRVLNQMGVNVEMISQGSSKTNIALIVDHKHGEAVVKALHKEFFEERNALKMPRPSGRRDLDSL